MNASAVYGRVAARHRKWLNPTSPLYLIALADTFGGLVQGMFPATLLLRTIMLAFLLIYVFKLSKKHSEIQPLWLLLLFYLLIRMVINYFIVLDERVLSVEGGATLKLIYFPMLYAFLLAQLENGTITRDHLRNCLLAYGWMTLASLLIGEATGLGGVIEGRGADIDGGKGFMIGANEVGLMLLLTAPFVGADIRLRIRSTVVGAMAQLLVYGLAGIHVFTKSSLIAALVAAYSAYRAVVVRGRAVRIMLWLFLCGLAVYAGWMIYENLDTNEAFALNTFFSGLLNDGIVSFIFRGRQDYISAIYPQLLDHPLNWLFLLFGVGEFAMREISIMPLMLLPGEGTTFEMDFFDLFGAYGLVGFLLYVCVVGGLLRRAGPSKKPAAVSVAIFCTLAHSFLAGHVLFSPQVTTILCLVLLYYRSRGGARA